MKPDPLFIIAGIVAAAGAAVIALISLRKRKLTLCLGAALWALLSAGLLVQGFAPHLVIANNAFVMPQSLVNGSAKFDPAAIVTRERHMQLLSAILTTASTIGLAFYYGRAIVRPQTAGP
jgi:hypothetical protein